MSHGVLTVAFLDIGQGDAVYIRTPSGKQMLYDAGPDAGVVRRLYEVMPKAFPWKRKSKTLDMIVLSHPDQDHVAGFSDVLRRFSVKALIDSGYEGEVENGFYKDILSYAKTKNIPILWGSSGTIIDLGGGVRGEIFAPEGHYTVGDTNMASIVLKLTYGSSSVLLSGDLPYQSEDMLVEKFGDRLHADIFKAGHHGSNTASGEKLLRTMNPKFIVVSSGRGNTYGHPSKSVTERFDRLGIPWMNTAKEGTIILETDGKEWRIKTETKK
jgi:beta-lactamase superfamily II metal-dependent hydrolase